MKCVVISAFHAHPQAMTVALRMVIRPAGMLLLAVATGAAEFNFRVEDRVLHPIDPRLFGQFLERASFGEAGPETLADPATGRLPDAVVEKLRALRIPVIRFPGGGDVDRIDWTDMIDRVPDREGGRPTTRVGDHAITNRFGYDEYFALREDLGCQTVLVLNLLDGLSKRRPLPQAALHAVGLVAYCAAPVGAALPAGMPDWPAVRAANGHPAPYPVEFVQLGNEWRHFHKEVAAATGLGEPLALARWYLEVLHAYIATIRAVAPAAALIVDGRVGDGIEQMILEDPRIRAEVRLVAFHSYAPGKVGPVRKDGHEASSAAMTPQDWWYASVMLPGAYTADGQAAALGGSIDPARGLGYGIACTEWNWNGWGYAEAGPVFTADFLPMAKALGAVGFLHGLMRQSDVVALATQSNLLGRRWHINTVRVDEQGDQSPYYLPQGMAAMLYARHHGDRLLAVSGPPPPTCAQPWTVGKWTSWNLPCRLALMELLASADDRTVFIHALNRDFQEAQDLTVDLSALGIGAASATQHRLTGLASAEPSPERCRLDEIPVPVKDGLLRIRLPPRSASIVAVPRP